MAKSSNETTYDWVCASLRESILNAEFQPGERLIISNLIKKFGISQMPIREALQKLQGEGLVSISAYKGAQVTKVDQKFVRDLYDYRTAVERMLVLKAYIRIPRIGIERLREIHANYQQIMKSDDADSLVRVNLEFHSAIFQYAENDVTLRILNSHSSLLSTLRKIYGFSDGRSAEVFKEHHDIIEALQNSKEERLLEAYELHCKNAKIDLLNEMEKGEKNTTKSA